MAELSLDKIIILDILQFLYADDHCRNRIKFNLDPTDKEAPNTISYYFLPSIQRGFMPSIQPGFIFGEEIFMPDGYYRPIDFGVFVKSDCVGLVLINRNKLNYDRLGRALQDLGHTAKLIWSKGSVLCELRVSLYDDGYKDKLLAMLNAIISVCVDEWSS